MIDREEARERINDWVHTPRTVNDSGKVVSRGQLTGVAIHVAFVHLEGDARTSRFQLRELDWETGAFE